MDHPVRAVDVTPILDRDYYAEAISLIKNAKVSVHLLMFELFYYPEYEDSKTNLLLEELVKASSRGLAVRVCVEGGEDYLGQEFLKKQLRAYEYLCERGVETKVDPGEVTTHAKLLIADGKTVLLGSTNWSYYAMEKNSEVNISVQSSSLASSFRAYFDRIWEKSSLLNSEIQSRESLESEGRSPIAELLRNPSSWDGKKVKISGQIRSLKKRRSRSGNLYSTFSLSDREGNSVKVFSWGHPVIDNGEPVEVEGVFKREKHVGKLTFYNEIEAKTVTRK